jgi:hypothetical protein
MTATHPGVVELAHPVAKLAGGSVDATDGERAVVLALELYRIVEISRMKLLEVARAAGPLPPELTTAVQAVEDEPLGDL